jgi:hypothetical protein
MLQWEVFSRFINELVICEISGSQGGEYEV